MNIRPDHGLTFDDVLLVPKRSSIRSRKDVTTTTTLVPGIPMAIPLISANMDTVTEAAMAVAMAQEGGIGILHRFMRIDQQVDEVRRVKRAESLVVDDPFSVVVNITVREARERMLETNVGGLMVVGADRCLLGVITNRDILLADDDDQGVDELMTPRERLVTGTRTTSLADARRLLHEHRIEKLPLVDEDDRLVGLITAQDIVKLQHHPQATKDVRGRLCVGIAIGVRNTDIDRAAACIAAGADVVVVDIAHGHSEHTLTMIRDLKQRFPGVPVIAGNVATHEGVGDLAAAGADAVKVGVGSGSICTTRIVTGFGVPQLSAISDCAMAGKELGIPIIADGGMRNSGDITKALAAGASSVMLGNMLAGTEESPGSPVIRDGRRYKIVRGMASLTANIERHEMESDGPAIVEWGEVVPEGVEAIVPYRGAVVDVIHQVIGGIRSGMSYAGACTIEELWQKAEFICITPSGMQESKPHNVDLI